MICHTIKGKGIKVAENNPDWHYVKNLNQILKKIKFMRNTALNTIFEIAKKNKRIIFLGSDLGVGVLNEMNKKIPKQFLMEEFQNKI